MNVAKERVASPWVMLEQIVAKVRGAETEAALYFSVVNDTFVILPYRSALVLAATTSGALQLTCASGLTTVDRQAPYGSWVEKVARHVLPRLSERSVFSKADLPDELASGWDEHWPECVSMYRMEGRQGELLAVMVYLLDVPWPPVADAMLMTLHRVQGLCLQALRHSRSWRWLRRDHSGRIPMATRLAGLAGLLALAAMFIPVRQFVVSPAEIISLDSVAVTSPVEGIVAELVARPSQSVRKGDVLVRLDDTAIRNRLASAEQALEVSRQEFLAGSHRAFASTERVSEVGVLKGRINERVAEVQFLREQLAMLDIRAGRDGVAVYGQENDLIGKPVAPGQKLMELADPQRIGVNVWVPVADAINIEAGAPVSVLLYADPLNPRTAAIERASYQAAKSPDGVVAYRVRGTLQAEDVSRLGLRGSAKIDGERVPLGYFLFRRPLLILRQWLGM
jgi:hypothetical protein